MIICFQFGLNFALNVNLRRYTEACLTLARAMYLNQPYAREVGTDG